MTDGEQTTDRNAIWLDQIKKRIWIAPGLCCLTILALTAVNQWPSTSAMLKEEITQAHPTLICDDRLEAWRRCALWEEVFHAK